MGGIVNSPPRLLVEDNGASHPLRESGGGLGMVFSVSERVPRISREQESVEPVRGLCVRLISLALCNSIAERMLSAIVIAREPFDWAQGRLPDRSNLYRL